MNKTSLIAVLPLVVISTGLAFGQSIYTKPLVNQVLEKPEIKELYADAFNVADVNNDGFVSENEFSYLIHAVETDNSLTATEKNEQKARLDNAFDKFDTDNDKNLNQNEFFNFQVDETYVQAQRNSDKFSETRNKILNAANPEAEAQKQMDKALENLQNMNETIKNISTEEFANNFISELTDSIVNENYFQMDKDKDNCVKQDEFVEYMRIYQKNQLKYDTEPDEKMLMSDEELAMWYEDIDKKQKDCLTKEEYIKDFSATMDFIAEK